MFHRVHPALYDGWGGVNAQGLKAALDAVLGPDAHPADAAWLFEMTMRFAAAVRESAKG